MQNKVTFLVIICLLLQGGRIIAQLTDTLKPVKVSSRKPLNIAATAVAVQQLDKSILGKMNSVSVADAVKYFSGVVVKDYGGIGGLKTISVRSLGANQTGVMYDGVVMNDAQGGQIDLGRLSIDHIETIQLFNNQPTSVLLPARSFASAAMLSLSTTGEAFSTKKLSRLNVRMGSFGFINPAFFYRGSLNKNMQHAFHAEYQSAKGDYPFIEYETGSSKRRRANSDIKAYRAEYNASYHFNDSNRVHLKVYYYRSERGLPGSVILYNNKTGERLNNRLFFTQASWQKTISSKSRLLISSKFSKDDKYYLDPNYLSGASKLENTFHQQEYYLSAVYAYKLSAYLTTSIAGDYFNTQLKRTDEFAINFADPERNTYLGNFAIQFKKNSIELNGNVLFTASREKVKSGAAGKPQSEFTPSLSAAIRPFQHFPLLVRASYKKIFRLPTFDDLYYTNIGNTSLRPEFADLYNLGATIKLSSETGLNEFIFTTDAYYNKVTDKILAIPRQNLFQWSMLNVGKVNIKGLDIGAHLNRMLFKNIEAGTHFSYSYQEAKDITDPASPLYNNQLPYTPVHSGSAGIHLLKKNLGFNYNIILSSFRYRQGEQTAENLVKEWATQDISVSYQISGKKHLQYKFLAEMNNMMNKQYEVIRYYPMPRFNYRVGVELTLHR